MLLRIFWKKTSGLRRWGEIRVDEPGIWSSEGLGMTLGATWKRRRLAVPVPCDPSMEFLSFPQKTFEEERREMLDNNRKRWNEAIQAHNEQEVNPVGALGSWESLRVEKPSGISESNHSQH